MDLVLDTQGCPHLVYYVDDNTNSVKGVVYDVCTANCESSAPTWEHEFVEFSDELDASDPIPTTGSCTLSYWLDVGRNPSLALDASGQPRVSYTAIHYQGGACTIHEDIRLVRFAVLAGSQPPPPGSSYKTYLPLLKVK